MEQPGGGGAEAGLLSVNLPTMEGRTTFYYTTTTFLPGFMSRSRRRLQEGSELINKMETRSAESPPPPPASVHGAATL